jgi:hypothetical protein
MNDSRIQKIDNFELGVLSVVIDSKESLFANVAK